ncbi:unnamed protein product [Ambrosiozyma monospora]|uniref:Unnamed protein product n=1 Tax=Ambrosiozyma monospora TaxID=43982 RepID=A0ACB5SVN0_AMBMO|nr:unnamed protein product [Ambrosiozyma monospora]
MNTKNLDQLSLVSMKTEAVECRIKELQMFISTLPSSVESMKLDIKGFETFTIRQDEISFRNLHELKHLDLLGGPYSTLIKYTTDFVNLRSLSLLTVGSETLCKLPPSLESLEIDTRLHFKPMLIVDFWDQFISPPKNLVNLVIFAKGSLELNELDFKEVQFPPYLSFVSIQFQYLKSNFICVGKRPPNLRSFNFSDGPASRDLRSIIVLDYAGDGSMSSIMRHGAGLWFRHEHAGIFEARLQDYLKEEEELYRMHHPEEFESTDEEDEEDEADEEDSDEGDEGEDNEDNEDNDGRKKKRKIA